MPTIKVAKKLYACNPKPVGGSEGKTIAHGLKLRDRLPETAGGVRFTSMLNYLLTYLFTPWGRILEKVTGLQLVKKFPAFYGTRRFITAVTTVRHLSLS